MGDAVPQAVHKVGLILYGEQDRGILRTSLARVATQLTGSSERAR
jgi:hypothetical protein